MTRTRVEAGNVWQGAAIGRITRETADCRSLELELERPQHALPGQYVMVAVTIGGVKHLRCYSLSSVAGIDERPKITVKRQPAGLVSAWFNAEARPSDVIEVSRPCGQFVVRPGAGPLFFFAAGSGITPIFAMLRSALEGSQRRVMLLDVNRTPDDVIFASELESLARAFPGRFTVEHAFTAGRGRIPDALLSRIVSGAKEAGDVYLCGPAGFMRSCERIAASHAIDAANVFSETFDSAADLGDLAGPPLRLFMQGRDGVNVALYSPEGATLLHALAQTDRRQIGICGGQASCGTCRVSIAAPWDATLAPASRSERRLLHVLPSPTDTHRLACQVRLTRAHTDLVFAHAPSTRGNVDD
jgi:3-ketosteroid 9alpha-monooxygenase subunit B